MLLFVAIVWFVVIAIASVGRLCCCGGLVVCWILIALP